MPNGPFTNTGNHSSLKTISGARDAKTGLGYGILNPNKQLPQQLGAEFPYYEQEDSIDEEPLDDETTNAVSKKYTGYRPSDFSGASGNDPFYFVGGNTKLSDCFWRTERVLQEIATFSDSMTPVGGYYKGMGPSMGGSGAAFPYQGGGGSNAKRTGSKAGWSMSPPMNKQQANEKEENDVEDQIFTLSDLADKNLADEGESPRKTAYLEAKRLQWRYTKKQ